MWPFTSSKRRSASTAAHYRGWTRMRLEALEDRCLMSAGALDPTFGNGAGYVTTPNALGARSVLIQPNGDIVAVGTALNSSASANQFSVERYNPDGSLDSSFGSGGVAQANFGSQSASGASGALYPAGTANAGDIVEQGIHTVQTVPNDVQDLAIARYNANGALDTTFGNGGEVLTAVPGMSSLQTFASGVDVTSSGQIVALVCGSGEFALVRYNANGSLDTSFGQGGYVITSLSGQEGGGLLQQANGDLIVYEGQGSVIDLYRFNPNGTLDSSFGNQGITSVTSPGGSLIAWTAALYPNAGTPNDGQIVFVTDAGTGGSVELARFNPNGSLDSTFGTGGFVQTQIYAGDLYQSAIAANGRIVVTGMDYRGGGDDSTSLARFNVNGTWDTTFGNGGLVTTTFGISSTGFAVAIYPNAGAATDGNIVVAGTASNGTHNVLVARYLGHATSPYFIITGPSSVTAGTVGTYTISIYNPDGSADTGYSGTVQIASSDPKALLPANFAISGSTATFSATLKTAGSQSLTATDTVTGSITGSDQSITVTPAVASQFILSAPSSVKSGSKFSVTLTVEDAYGNVVTGYVGTVHFSSSDGTATLPVDFTFTAADAGVHTFTNKAILKKRGAQTITVADTLNTALTTTDTISVT
jgi:uncharacterized delta-60 repeat protein